MWFWDLGTLNFPPYNLVIITLRHCERFSANDLLSNTSGNLDSQKISYEKKLVYSLLLYTILSRCNVVFLQINKDTWLNVSYLKLLFIQLRSSSINLDEWVCGFPERGFFSPWISDVPPFPSRVGVYTSSCHRFPHVCTS